MTRPPRHNERPRLVRVKVPDHPCVVCGALYAPFGFGERDQRFGDSDELWACREHRAEVDARAVAQGLVKPLPEGG